MSQDDTDERVGDADAVEDQIHRQGVGDRGAETSGQDVKEQVLARGHSIT